MPPQKKTDIADVEKAAAALLALMLDLCERQVTPGKEPPRKHKALASCAVAVQAAVRTFVDITRM